MKKVNAFLLFCAIANTSFGQVADKKMDKILNTKEVERIETVLSADDMEGRKTFTLGIDRAADFIAKEFKKTGLEKWNNSGSYLQSFALVNAKPVSVSGVFDDKTVSDKNVIVVTTLPEVQVTETSGFEKATIAKGADFRTETRKYVNVNKNFVVFVDTSFSSNFNSLNQSKGRLLSFGKSVVFILTADAPKTFSVTAKHEISEQKLANVLGVLPGKSLKNEYVVISGHYDHLGVNGKRAVNGDSIFNGANDDAAGTTAVMMLAKYFKKLHNNERTLIFVAFTGEEVGGFGASYFSRQFNPEDVKAMFNIEMIGTESKWGKNSAYITGYEETNMGKILQGNLEGTGFTFYPDPYTSQGLFYRSDNATLARQGVPAHTISTSKMDNEPNYHKPSDEIGTLDMENMTKIMKAIALSSKGIISGKETPSRVNPAGLRAPR